MDAFIGTILPWPLSWAPMYWALCQGQLMPINQNQALYSLLGTVYGGDGVNNFGLPDLRCRLPLGAGTGVGLTPRNPGDRGGAESAQLSIPNLPAHTHAATFTPAGGPGSATVQASTQQGNTTTAQGNFLASPYYPGDPNSGSGPAVLANYVTPDTAGTLQNIAGVSISGGGGTVAVGATGNNAPVATMPPFLALNYIICLNGIFPSRP